MPEFHERLPYGPVQRNRLVLDHLRLVPFVIRRYFQGRRLWPVGDQDDLTQVGHLGLLAAAQRWDPTKGTFATFAVATLRYLMHNALARGGLIRLPEKDRLEESPHLRVFRNQAQVVWSLEEDGGQHAAAKTNVIPDPNGSAGLDAVDEQDEQVARLRLLWRLLKVLTPREETILRLRHFQNQTLAEVSKVVGVTRERVRQIEAKALDKMRRQAGHLATSKTEQARQAWEALWQSPNGAKEEA